MSSVYRNRHPNGGGPGKGGARLAGRKADGREGRGGHRRPFDAELVRYDLRAAADAAQPVPRTVVATARAADQAGPALGCGRGAAAADVSVHVGTDLLHHLIDSVPGYAIFMLDPDGRLASWNAGASRLTGYGADEVVGRPVAVLYPSEDVRAGKPDRELRAAATEGSFWSEGWRVRKDGSRFWADVVVTALNDADGRPHGFGKVARDLTEQRRAEREQARLYEAARRACCQLETTHLTHDELMLGISHDLKGPLTSVRGYAQMLQRLASRADTLPAGRVAELAGRVDAVAVQMARQIDQMVDVARLQVGQALALRREPTDVAALLRRLVDERAAARQDWVVRLEAPATEITGSYDPARLERVFANLLDNALKYSPEGGGVVVAVARQDEGGRAGVRVSVYDQGVGIPEADLPHVFEQFYRASNVRGRIRGSGVGLAAVRRLVEMHGGTVSAESRLGAGSTFTVWLPVDG